MQFSLFLIVCLDVYILYYNTNVIFHVINSKLYIPMTVRYDLPVYFMHIFDLNCCYHDAIFLYFVDETTQ